VAQHDHPANREITEAGEIEGSVHRRFNNEGRSPRRLCTGSHVPLCSQQLVEGPEHLDPVPELLEVQLLVRACKRSSGSPMPVRITGAPAEASAGTTGIDRRRARVRSPAP